MLFALDWISAMYDATVAAIERFIGGVTIASVGAALTGSPWRETLCVVGALLLCLCGFKRYKLVSGLVGGALFGYWGWKVGVAIGSSFATVPILYMLIMAVCGFFLMYIFYFANVCTGMFLLLWSARAFFPQLSAHVLLPAAFAAALAYTVCFVKWKLTVSALTGALALGLIAYFRFGATLAAAAGGVFAVVGIVVQRVGKRRSDGKKAREHEEQLEKYPYGPGLRDAQKAEREAKRAEKALQEQAAAGAALQQQSETLQQQSETLPPR